MADDSEFKVRFKTYVETIVDSVVSMNILGMIVPAQGLRDLVRDYLGEEWLDQMSSKAGTVFKTEEGQAWITGLIESAPEYAEAFAGLGGIKKPGSPERRWRKIDDEGTQ